MNVSKKNIFFQTLIYVCLFIFSLIIIYLHKNDIILTKSWTIYYLWLINCFLALAYLFFKIPRSLYSRVSLIISQDVYILTLVLILAFFTRFFLLSTYPYVTLGDGLRDAGLNALKIKKGLLKDFFDFGAYQGYGNFIPLISFFFISVFKNSPLVYLVPSSLIGILSILATYLLSRIWGGKKVAVIASFFLVGSLFHLHYSRTELLVIMDSLLSPLIILFVYSAFFFFEGYFLAGLIFGFAFHFYAGIRGVLFISVFYLFLEKTKQLILFLIKKDFREFYLNLKRMILEFTVFCIGLIITLGPTLNKINFGKDNNLISKVGNAKLIFLEDEFIKKDLKEKINFLYKNYEKSFLVYVFNTAKDNAFHFYFDSPLLNFPLNWFFLVGLFYLLIKKDNSKKKQLTNLLIFIIFLFPITNQVIINTTGDNHRLMSILPVLSIFAAYGLVVFFEKLTVKYSGIIIGIIVFFYLFSQLLFYFINRPSDLAFDEVGLKEYVFQKIVEFIKRDTFYDTYFILNNDQFNYDSWHYLEKIKFFTYPKQVELVDKDSFLSKISLYQVQKNKKAAFIFIKQIPEIEHYEKVVYETQCLKQILPNYDCPNNFIGSYYFYLLKI